MNALGMLWTLIGFVVAVIVLINAFQARNKKRKVEPIGGLLTADAGVITDADGNVIEWRDQSGHGNHMLGSTPYPYLTSNPKHGVSCPPLPEMVGSAACLPSGSSTTEDDL